MKEQEFTNMIEELLSRRDYYSLKDILQTETFKKTIVKLCKLQSARIEIKTHNIKNDDRVLLYNIKNDECSKVFKAKHGYTPVGHCRISSNTHTKNNLTCGYGNVDINFSRKTGKQLGTKEPVYYIVAEKWLEQ